MTQLTRLATALIFGMAMIMQMGNAAAAQQGGPFAPRLIVNDRAITNWEVQQRLRLLQLFNTPGDLEELALEGLTEDRLRLDAGAAQGIELPEEQLTAGLEEFASRSNLELEEFLAAVGRAGIAAQTVRDLVRAGLVWREVVRSRFAPRARVLDEELDRALALSSRPGSARVLLSEIILRADTPEFQAESQALAARLSREITTTGGFAAAARRYSVSNSAARGGRVDWLDLTQLPPQIASQVLTLGPGEVTDPIPVPNAIALFQLRAIEETEAPQPETLSVEFGQFFLPGASQQDADRVVAKLDSCDDLYGVAKGLPEERLQIETLPVAEVPADIALELAKLDDRETTVLTRGNTRVVLMLCARTVALDESVDRESIRLQLFNQRLAAYASSYLEELKADAIIREP